MWENMILLENLAVFDFLHLLKKRLNWLQMLKNDQLFKPFLEQMDKCYKYLLNTVKRLKNIEIKFLDLLPSSNKQRSSVKIGGLC